MALENPDSTGFESELFDQNLAAFKRWAPRLYSRLTAIESTNSNLIVDADGRVDMALRGQGFYNGDAEAYVSRQLEKYFENPLRQTINEPDPEKLKGTCGSFCQGLTKWFVEEGISYDKRLCPVESHSLIVFGIGLGLHVGPLLERTGAKVVLLIEPNIECLFHSLFLMEWHLLFDQAEAEDREITFIVERESATIASIAKRILHKSNPALIDGVYHYSHYPSTILEQAKDQIRHDLFLTLSGMGYFEDELKMTRNASTNLRRAPLAVLGRYHPARHEPAFIVGSGPSVEQDLDVIAEYADRAIIFSIGTGLGVLLNHGVRPDFHVELENGVGTPQLVAMQAEDHDLSGITLIASLTVQEAMFPHFDKCMYFFRERVSSTELFSGPFDVVQPAGPTVANTATICAIRMGFRRLYLFGCDMGTKAEGRFHAEGSVYGKGGLPERNKASQSYPGNFGGMVTGETVFNWSRRVLEGVLKAHRGLLTFNCSDGARIDGAIPLVSRVLKLEDEPVDRTGFLETMATSLHRYDQERFREAWDSKERRAELETTFDRIDAILDQASTADEPEMNWLHEVYDIIRPGGDGGIVAKSFLSGTLSICMGASNWYDRRLCQEDRRAEVRRKTAEMLRQAVADMRSVLETLYDEVDEIVAGP